MFYVFTWTSEYEVRLETQKWKKLFTQKHGDFNLTHIRDFASIERDFIAESLLSNSLFASKKLIIIDIDTTQRKSADLDSKYEFLLKNIQNTSQDTIVLISFPKPDKRSKIYKWLIKVAEKVQVYDEKKAQDLLYDLQRIYSKTVSKSALDMLVRYKSWNHAKIVSEIEKLSILYDYIDTKQIQQNISPELEESIFVLIDNILNKNTKQVFENLRIIANDSNMYLLYNSLLANIRTTFYIELLKSKKIPSFTIKTELSLWNRWFLVDKSYRMNFESISGLYRELISLDRKMKTGKMIGSEEKDFLFEIEGVVRGYL